jgi:hypothetical protein
MAELGVMNGRPKGFKEFYTVYRGQHRDPANRFLHLLGTVAMLGMFTWSWYERNWWGLIAAPVLEYGMSWAGHFFVEGNKPLSLAEPSYSLLGSFCSLLRGSSVTDAARASLRHGYYCFIGNLLMGWETLSGKLNS